MNIIIETVKGSRAKFIHEPKTNTFRLKRLLPAGMVFPCDFGFIPGTIGEDGDPLDAIILSEIETFTGCQLECRLIGSMQVLQQKGGKKIRNDRYVFIPEASQEFAHIQTIGHLPARQKKELEEFFIQYNKLQGKTLDVLGWIAEKAALSLIQESADNRQPMHLVQIFLPVTDSYGERFPDQFYRELRQTFTQDFGGVSIYEQAPVTGLWAEEEGTVNKDRLIIFEVMVPFIDPLYWQALKKRLETEFRQQEVLIRQMGMGKV